MAVQWGRFQIIHRNRDAPKQMNSWIIVRATNDGHGVYQLIVNMKLSTRILLGFSIVLILSIIDTTSNYLLSLKVESNIEFLNRSQEIIRNSSTIHKSIIDMQSSFRGYLLTQDTRFLDGYNSGFTELPKLFAEQKGLVKESRRPAPYTRYYRILAQRVAHLHRGAHRFEKKYEHFRKCKSSL